MLHTWGSVGWQTQGWAAVHECARRPEMAAFVCEIADWAIQRQLKKNGAFLEDLSPDEPSFNSAFIAEGIATAWALADRVGEQGRASRYAQSWCSAAHFFSQLIIQPEDTFWMRRPAQFIGGVRPSHSRSTVRIDQVSHCLHALCLGAQNLRLGPTSSSPQPAR